MTNIRNNSGFVPQRSFQQPPRPSGQQSDLHSQLQSRPQQPPLKDEAKAPTVAAGPTETTMATQKQQELTAPATQTMLHQLIMKAEIRPPKERPKLSILKRSSMSLLLAETLGAYAEDEDGDEQPDDAN